MLRKLHTKADYIRAHRKLWDWLYKNPSKQKCDWPGWEDNGGEYEDLTTASCFACDCESEVVSNSDVTNILDEDYRCYMNCPFIWPGGDCCVDTIADKGKGIYSRWKRARSRITRKKYAAMIRDLPVRRTKK